MQKKLTITIDERVYEGLYRVVGAGKISQFIEKLVRPHVLDEDLEAAYARMAQDTEREAEAYEWSEALIADANDETRGDLVDQLRSVHRGRDQKETSCRDCQQGCRQYVFEPCAGGSADVKHGSAFTGKDQFGKIWIFPHSFEGSLIILARYGEDLLCMTTRIQGGVPFTEDPPNTIIVDTQEQDPTKVACGFLVLNFSINGFGSIESEPNSYRQIVDYINPRSPNTIVLRDGTEVFLGESFACHILGKPFD